MDTTLKLKYVKMCGKAQEIQELWEPRAGDIFAYELDNPFSDNFGIYLGDIPTSKKHLSRHFIRDIGGITKGFRRFEKEKYIWLPRQDQLQEMCEPPLDVLLMEFWEWLPKYEVGVKFTSMEQLWLSFVMKEKYEKVWDGEEWVKRGIDKGIDK
jgi:hypothetical protein